MPPQAATKAREREARSLTRLIDGDASVLSAQLRELRQRAFPPDSAKELRRFTSGEAARLIGVSDGYLRSLSLAGEGPEPEKTNSGRRLYTLEQVNEGYDDLLDGKNVRGVLVHDHS